MRSMKITIKIVTIITSSDELNGVVFGVIDQLTKRCSILFSPVIFACNI